MDPTQWEAPFGVIAAALFVIVLARANGTYWLGRGLAAGGRKTRLQSVLDSSSYLRAESWLQRWGAPAVAVSFLTIGAQTMVNLSAGVARMPLRRYLPAMALGCLVWALLYASVGLVGFEAVSTLWRLSPGLTVAVLAAIAVATVTLVALRSRRRLLGSTASSPRP